MKSTEEVLTEVAMGSFNFLNIFLQVLTYIFVLCCAFIGLIFYPIILIGKGIDKVLKITTKGAM